MAIRCSLLDVVQSRVFPIRNLTASQHVLLIVCFFYLFPDPYTRFPLSFYHLLLRPGTARFFGNRRCDFQQSNVAMLVFCIFLHPFKFACLLKIYLLLFWLLHRCATLRSRLQYRAIQRKISPTPTIDLGEFNFIFSCSFLAFIEGNM